MRGAVKFEPTVSCNSAKWISTDCAVYPTKDGSSRATRFHSGSMYAPDGTGTHTPALYPNGSLPLTLSTTAVDHLTIALHFVGSSVGNSISTDSRSPRTSHGVTAPIASVVVQSRIGGGRRPD